MGTQPRTSNLDPILLFRIQNQLVLLAQEKFVGIFNFVSTVNLNIVPTVIFMAVVNFSLYRFAFLGNLLVVSVWRVALCLGWGGGQKLGKMGKEGEAKEQGKGKGEGMKEKRARREEGGCNEMGLEGDRNGARIWFS